MAKYRKKPVEAVQFFTGTWDWWPNKDYCDIFGRKCTTGCCPPGAHLHTSEGAYVVREGDWVITDEKGNQSICKPDIFEQTYELVEEQE